MYSLSYYKSKDSLRGLPIIKFIDPHGVNTVPDNPCGSFIRQGKPTSHNITPIFALRIKFHLQIAHLEYLFKYILRQSTTYHLLHPKNDNIVVLPHMKLPQVSAIKTGFVGKTLTQGVQLRVKNQPNVQLDPVSYQIAFRRFCNQSINIGMRVLVSKPRTIRPSPEPRSSRVPRRPSRACKILEI
jgi:hypothetical protein